jgi:hypothetical protein
MKYGKNGSRKINAAAVRQLEKQGSHNSHFTGMDNLMKEVCAQFELPRRGFIGETKLPVNGLIIQNRYIP